MEKSDILVSKITNNLFVKSTTYNIDAGYMYMEMFNHYPTYKYTVDINRIDDEEDFDIYDAIFKDLEKSGDFETILYEYNKDILRDDIPHSDRHKSKVVYVDRFFLVKKDEPVMIYYEYDCLMIVSHLGIGKIDEIFEKYLKKFDQEDTKVKCYVVVKDPDMYLDSIDIKLNGDLDLDLYNEGFDEIHNEIVRSINEDDNGLYLLYGEPGTGKTTYIKHLIKKCATEKKKFIYVPSKLFEDFTDPSILPFLLKNKGCVYVIEDCENLITVDDGYRSDGISDLLNMTDGILSDGLKIKIICTFNTDFTKIDEALLRPGRCRCKYEFKLLDKNRANKAAEKLNLKKVNKDVSLAEFFNPDIEHKDDKKKKIGFSN